jgi:DNA gyrase/topoisomerase IV subunit B
MVVFIYTYLRPLIEAGKVYKVFSPLYRIDDKEHPFVVSKTEMVEIFQKKVAKQYKLTTEAGHQFDKDEMIEFLQDTYSYSSDLVRMSKNLGNVNKFLVEQIIALLTVSGYVRSGKDYDDFDKLFADQKFIKKLMSRIQEKFPEITVNQSTHTLKGVVNGKDQLICGPFVNSTRRPPHGPNQRSRYGCGKCQVATPCESGIPGKK